MKKLLFILVFGGVLGGIGFLLQPFFRQTATIHDLFLRNSKLEEALEHLGREEQIGFAKVIRQEKCDGVLYTTLHFVQTARGDLLEHVLEREFTIEGDVIHFDALIVSFPNEMVQEGRANALYLWRRVYGETMSPSEGFSVDEPGAAPARYAELLSSLKLEEQTIFWEAIWDLSDDPMALHDLGIKAVYGNVVYKRLRPGLIYIFKIGANGQVYPETVPDI